MLDETKAKPFGIAGAVVTLVGMYLPIFSSKWAESSNYFGLPAPEYMLTLTLVVGAFALSFTKYIHHIKWIGIALAVVIFVELFRTWSALNDNSNALDSDMSSLASLHPDLLSNIKPALSFGWIVLLIGAALIIVGGLTAKKRTPGVY